MPRVNENIVFIVEEKAANILYMIYYINVHIDLRILVSPSKYSLTLEAPPEKSRQLFEW